MMKTTGDKTDFTIGFNTVERACRQSMRFLVFLKPALLFIQPGYLLFKINLLKQNLKINRYEENYTNLLIAAGHGSAK
jgi:hypothetical protein